MDSIIARGMTFRGCHGVMAQEKITPQVFKVDLEMFLDLKNAARQDDLQSTIDYDQVYHLVEKIVEVESFALIETLAEEIAGVLLKTFPQMDSVEVTVFKPEPPVEGEFDYFAVKIKRFQK
ncbi:MAG: dihydroneopterin aldolase [Syntrophomonas sp.]|nr:dihydroneopterin aldolase [Syntrophomonas sp.]